MCAGISTAVSPNIANKKDWDIASILLIRRRKAPRPAQIPKGKSKYEEEITMDDHQVSEKVGKALES